MRRRLPWRGSLTTSRKAFLEHFPLVREGFGAVGTTHKYPLTIGGVSGAHEGRFGLRRFEGTQGVAFGEAERWGMPGLESADIGNPILRHPPLPPPPPFRNVEGP